MPAYVAPEVVFDAFFHEIIGFIFAIEAVEEKAFHGKSLSVFWELFEDLVSCFDSFLVEFALWREIMVGGRQIIQKWVMSQNVG